MDTPNRFAALAAPGVRSLSPYLPGKPTATLERELGIKGSIKLASNENPLGPGPRARAALAAAIHNVGHYPDGSGHGLRSRLAHRLGVDIDQVTLGNGSNDVLVLLAEAFLVPGVEAVYSQFAFAVYPSAVQASGATARVAPAWPADHAQPLGHDPAALAAAVGPRTRMMFVANPKQPDRHLARRRATRCAAARSAAGGNRGPRRGLPRILRGARRAGRHALAAAPSQSRGHADIFEGLRTRRTARGLRDIASGPGGHPQSRAAAVQRIGTGARGCRGGTR